MHGPLTYEEAGKVARDFLCAECGGNLINPWGGAYGIQGHVIRCVKSKDHQGIKRRGPATKTLYDIEKGKLVKYTMDGKPAEKDITALVPQTISEMVSRVQEARDLGMFQDAKNMTTKQVDNLARMALTYRLDPLMNEIVPLHGRPLITIEGRRRIDIRSGHNLNISIVPMDRETYFTYSSMGAIEEGDVVVMGRFQDLKSNATIETIGRVRAEEKRLKTWTDKEGKKKSNADLPTVKWPLEMAMKRCEARGRKILYGPVGLPEGLADVYEEDSMEEVHPEFIDAAYTQVDEETGEILGNSPNAPESPPYGEDSASTPSDEAIPTDGDQTPENHAPSTFGEIVKESLKRFGKGQSEIFDLLHFSSRSDVASYPGGNSGVWEVIIAAWGDD